MTIKREMFYGADPTIFDNARLLRKNLTHEELVFWGRLKERFPQYRFRRQHPISIYIADFYCHPLKLIIEIDGSIHDIEEVKKNDLQRQQDLEKLGLTMLSFSNTQIKNESDFVIDIISKFIEKHIK